jgi:replicative DNA helicase
LNAQQLIPPHDLSAEQAVLSAAMLDPLALDECVDVLRGEHFFAPAHGLIWEAIVSVSRKGDPVDIVTVKHELDAKGKLAQAEGARYLGDIIDATPATANVSAHASRIIELAKLRAAIAACHRLAALGYSSASDVSAYIDRCEADIISVGATDRVDQGEWMRTVAAATYNKMRAVSEGSIEEGVRTGFNAYDEMTGGLHEGDLHVIAARPGMGKTALALDIARNIAKRGDAVAFFSAEMPKEQLSMRLIAAEGGRNLIALRRVKLTDQDWLYVAEATDKVAALPFYVDDAAGLSVLDIRGRARRLQRKVQKEGGTLSGIFIDYLQLLRPSRPTQSREQDVAEASRECKLMAKSLSVPVVLCAQLNREVEKRKPPIPMLSDLRESGAIEQDADTVTFVYREGYYEVQAGKKDETNGRTSVLISKQRNGPPGGILLRFWPGPATFGPWDDKWETERDDDRD